MPMGSRVTSVLACSILLGAGWLGPVTAHPHVWVKVKSAVLIDDGSIIGVRHDWTLDKAFADGAVEEFDTDGNGTLSAAELLPLIELNTSTLKEFRSFTVVRRGGDKISLEDPKDVSMDYQGDLLAVHFTVPLSKPVPVSRSEFHLEIYDPTFFSVFELAGSDPVVLEAKSPVGCHVTLALAPGGEQQKAINEFSRQFGRGLVRMAPAKRATMTCKD